MGRTAMCWICSVVVVITGCNTPRGGKVDIIKAEIATLTSIALTNRALSQEQRNKIVTGKETILDQMEDLK